mmetsp:Transcript_35106/g.69272  ORF Transcript_35106/g.69272 Transcript_35106/m.69272 type:complete len:267 (+) Transcript_35106:849-1649(+)
MIRVLWLLSASSPVTLASVTREDAVTDRAARAPVESTPVSSASAAALRFACLDILTIVDISDSISLLCLSLFSLFSLCFSFRFISSSLRFISSISLLIIKAEGGKSPPSPSRSIGTGPPHPPVGEPPGIIRRLLFGVPSSSLMISLCLSITSLASSSCSLCRSLFSNANAFSNLFIFFCRNDNAWGMPSRYSFPRRNAAKSNRRLITGEGAETSERGKRKARTFSGTAPFSVSVSARAAAHAEKMPWIRESAAFVNRSSTSPSAYG